MTRADQCLPKVMIVEEAAHFELFVVERAYYRDKDW